ncbi:MAG: carboxypeptidase regulatory-like domain-containing protein [Gemmatimonadota bacterium]|nr:carboxypeptidase regulatory-like domain-containing protein [Gemmatimonadota bacterium]
MGPSSARRRWRFAALLLAAVSPAVASAQRVTGAVRDSLSRLPIAGAVVTMSDGAGRTLRQLITDTAGRFGATVPAGRVRVRVLRIGFRPVQRTVEARPGSATALDLAMPEISIVLAAVRTSSEKICGEDDRPGSAAAELWQQARAGLLATVVARQAVPAAVRVLEYRQVYDAGGAHLLQQRARISAGSSQRPFAAAATARDFEHTGFVVDADDGRTYYAPDADVLLDPQFAANHCFSVTADPRRHPDEIGLAFEPAKNAPDAIVDVAGTLWLRSGTPELRSMSFGYVRIEDAAREAGAGGTIDFSTMPNGVVMLSRWDLTAPVLRRRRSYRWEPGVWQYDVTQVQHIGGILADASWPGGLHWHGPVGTVVGLVVRGRAASPAPGVRVWLEKYADTVTTDARGAFRFRDLLPGPYTIHAEDPALAPFDAEPPLRSDITVPDRADTLRPMVLLSYDDVERRLCEGQPLDSQTTVLVGNVRDDSRQSDAGTDLKLTWAYGGAFAGTTTRLVHAVKGRFAACGIPRGVSISIHALRDTTVWLDSTVTAPAGPLGIVTLDLAPRPRPAAARGGG